MENAQKALIIAAGLFLTIALITITVIIFNVASGAMGNTTENIDNTQTEMGQAQLTAIIGKNVSADAARQTIRSIVTNNIPVKVNLDGSGKTGVYDETNGIAVTNTNLNTFQDEFINGQKYAVSAKYTDTGALKIIVFNGKFTTAKS